MLFNRPLTACGNRESDIVFLLDSSNSQGPENFEDQKNFVSTFITRYTPGLGDQGVQISVVTFESNVHNQFDLNAYVNKSDILAAIQQIPFTPGNTLTDKALEYVVDHSFSNASGDRPEANNILVILTDGQSTDKNQTVVEADRLHHTSTRVIAIGIGNGIDSQELLDIASSPNLVFNVDTFAALPTIEAQIGEVTCISK